MKYILKAIVFLVSFYFSISYATYDIDPDPYGFWHYLTRGKGWINDNNLGSGSLHWLFPYNKEKERAYYNEHFKR